MEGFVNCQAPSNVSATTDVSRVIALGEVGAIWPCSSYSSWVPPQFAGTDAQF